MTTAVYSLFVAMTIYGEAGVEEYAGRRAVASVIYNRAIAHSVKTGRSMHYSLIAVYTERKAFSCWSKPFEINKDSDIWKECVALAQAKAAQADGRTVSSYIRQAALEKAKK